MFSATILQIPLAVAIVGGLWTVWRLARNYVLKSPLDNVPGPGGGSIIKGQALGPTFIHANLACSPGNAFKMFERHCWPFLDNLTTGYSGVAKLHDLLGEQRLWVSDPLALHHIVIKDQDRYPLSSVKSSYAAFFEPCWPATDGPQSATAHTRSWIVGHTRWV